MIDYMLVMRASNRNKVQDMSDKFPKECVFTAGKKAWSVPCDIALPCAFQNELSEDDAKETLGDIAELQDGVIVGIAERKNCIIRPPLANLDRLFIVSSASQPSSCFWPDVGLG